MGNTSSTSSVPKYLKPSKHKKKSNKSSIRSNQSEQKENIVTPQLVQHTSLFTEEEDEAETFGSGPKNAFQWFEGRRFMSYNKQVHTHIYLIFATNINIENRAV